MADPARCCWAPGYRRYDEQADPALLSEAVAAARAAEVAVVMVGLAEVFETEGADREYLRLPAVHGALVRAVVSPDLTGSLVDELGTAYLIRQGLPNLRRDGCWRTS